jgi:hypothetical protein
VITTGAYSSENVNFILFYFSNGKIASSYFTR